MSQFGLPSAVSPQEIAREKTLGGAMELCAKAAGFTLDKELQSTLKVDKGQFSRWMNGTEGVVWPKFRQLMDVCGNHAPVLWMLHQLDYDITSLRKLESETERQLRLSQEHAAKLELENEVLRRAISGR